MQKVDKECKVLALFDFCETLVDFQSAERYLQLVAKYRDNIKRSRGIRYRIYMKLRNKIEKRLKRMLPKSWRKSFIKSRVDFEILRDLEVIEAERIAQEFFETELLSHLNNHVIERIRYHQKLGHTIVIVSGGFEIYIRIFANHFNIPYVVAVSLEKCDGILSGNMDGIHTMEHRKLYKLKQTINLSNYNLKESYAYSDCPSDIPLLSLVGNSVVVECGKDIEWAKILGFSII